MPSLTDRIPQLRGIIRDEIRKRVDRGLHMPLYLYIRCREDELPASMAQFANHANLFVREEDKGILLRFDLGGTLGLFAEALPSGPDEPHEMPDKPVTAVVILERDLRGAEVVRFYWDRVTGYLEQRVRFD